MINSNQIAILWLNDDKDNGVAVVDFNIRINDVDRFVSADITCVCYYRDNNPIFSFFIQKQLGKIHITVTDDAVVEGPTKREIVFEQAMITSFHEAYDSQQLASESRNVYFNMFSIHANTIDMGNASITLSA